MPAAITFETAMLRHCDPRLHDGQAIAAMRAKYGPVPPMTTAQAKRFFTPGSKYMLRLQRVIRKLQEVDDEEYTCDKHNLQQKHAKELAKIGRLRARRHVMRQEQLEAFIK